MGESCEWCERVLGSEEGQCATPLSPDCCKATKKCAEAQREIVTQVLDVLGAGDVHVVSAATCAATRLKLVDRVAQCLAVSDDDLYTVLARMPYRVGETWMVNEPSPGVSEKMGYSCYEAKILDRAKVALLGEKS